MLVTVVIVNWNSGELLSICLNKLQQQTIKPRIIVLDNASSDNSIACVASYPDITLLPMNTNTGFAAGNNYALNHCHTEFVALLNPDAFPEPDWLECLLTAAKENPDVAAFGSRQLRLNASDVLDGIGDSYYLSGMVLRKRYGVKQQPDDLVSREIFSPCAAAALYRRQALTNVGGFDDDYFCYVEDVDLGFRLRLQGYRAMYVADAIVHHVGSATTGGKHSDFSVYYGHRNLLWTFVKNMPGYLFYLLLPLHLLINLAAIVYFILRGQGLIILRSKLDAIKGLPKMWKKRQEIQKNRLIKPGVLWSVLDKHVFANAKI
jgi:GT2 family glycosyltransferase